MIKSCKTLGLLLLTGLLATRWVVADSDDPPGRVARLSYAQGSVSFEPAGTEAWVEAVRNRPVTIGDRLWVDDGGRAELDIGSAAIRLSGGTSFSFLDLDQDVAQIELTQGVIFVHLRDLDRDETFEIDAPNLAFNLERPGDYRIETNEAGDSTLVYVRGGQGEVTGGGAAFTVRSDQRAAFIGTDHLESFIEGAGDYDDFDRWAIDRDRREEQALSAGHVPRGVIGYEDLAEYGNWREVPEYGEVWIPSSVAADWAPYRYGQWTWISPWGWTWVDDAPWGFAPFHYGRWAVVGGVWGWCPAPVAVASVGRAVYAPALVAWVGGSSFSIGVGIGESVGWFPLAPREVYVPPYQTSRAYVTNVNITNTTVNNTVITNVYDNRAQVDNIRYANRTALTATSRAVLTSAQPVARNLVPLERAQIARAQVTTGAAAVPQQKSVVGAAPPAARQPPARVVNRAVVARRTPPPAPVAFAKEQRAIEANGGRPLARDERQRLEPQHPVAPVKVVQQVSQPVPIETVARRGGPQRGQPGLPSGAAESRQVRPPAPPETPATPPQPRVSPPSRPSEPSPPAVTPRPEDRPPAARPSTRPSPAIPPPTVPPSPAPNPRAQLLQQKQLQEQQRLQQQQEQQRLQLDQRHQQQLQRNGQQAETQRQLLEHQQLAQQQELRNQQLLQKQQRQRQKVEEQEAKKKKPQGQ